MNARSQRVKQMMQTPDHCSQFESNKFRVRSQTDPSKFYIVTNTGNGLLVCECPDHTTRNADCKHIKIVLDIMEDNKCYRNSTFRIMERSKLELRKHCDSGNIIKKDSRRTRTAPCRGSSVLNAKGHLPQTLGLKKNSLTIP